MPSSRLSNGSDPAHVKVPFLLLGGEEFVRVLQVVPHFLPIVTVAGERILTRHNCVAALEEVSEAPTGPRHVSDFPASAVHMKYYRRGMICGIFRPVHLHEKLRVPLPTHGRAFSNSVIHDSFIRQGRHVDNVRRGIRCETAEALPVFEPINEREGLCLRRGGWRSSLRGEVGREGTLEVRGQLRDNRVISHQRRDIKYHAGEAEAGHYYVESRLGHLRELGSRHNA
mmetsp:Transcript_22349/g.42009  ORF Transcript_22349/g.42009 Transcript_22349/m.42009 type:complete len:227 (+) Transcript_22349:671-1351(+)